MSEDLRDVGQEICPVDLLPRRRCTLCIEVSPRFEQ